MGNDLRSTGADLTSERRPCSVPASTMSVDEFIKRFRTVLERDHGWELKFVREVLGRVPGLDFRSVRPQTRFVDDAGVPRRIDFTITEGPYVNVALEVDGFRKDGRDPDYEYFEKWLLREQEIVRRGWTLLRFANRTVERRPADAARNIELTLELERERARRLEQAERNGNLNREALERAAEAERRMSAVSEELAGVRDQERQLQDRVAGTPLASPSAAVKEEVEAVGRRASELERQLADDLEVAHRGADIVIRARQHVELSTPATELHELDRLNREREGAVRNLAEELRHLTQQRDAAHREVRGIKTVAVACAIVVLAVGAITFALTSGSAGSGSAEPVSSPSPGNEECQDAIEWSDAGDKVGESATLRGRVVTGTYRARSNGAPTFLNVGLPFPDPARLVIVIFGDSRSKFPRPPERFYDGKDIAVTGQITEFDGVTQVEINTPSAIETC